MSARVAWCTDLHLDFLGADDLEKYHASLRNLDADVLLVGGDISHAYRLEADLLGLKEACGKPVHFVLGNHDYYGGSLQRSWDEVSRLCASESGLRWLSEAGVCELDPQTGLIGTDGWADMRLGDPERAIVLHDEYYIDELRDARPHHLRDVLQQLASTAAAHIDRTLRQAVSCYSHTFLLTHVPPFRESCLRNGQASGDEWLPRYTCAAVGDAICRIMSQHPDRRLTVLCGHSHAEAYAEPLPNVAVWTGGAEYGSPRMQRIWEV